MCPDVDVRLAYAERIHTIGLTSPWICCSQGHRRTTPLCRHHHFPTIHQPI